MSLKKCALPILVATAIAAFSVDAVLAQGQFAPYPFVNELVSSTGNRHHAVKLDAAGNPHVSYWDSGPDELAYAVRVDGVWNVEFPAPGIIGGDHNDLALDSQGNPHISFYDFTNDVLRYATKSGGIWTSEQVGVASGIYTSITIDSQDRPHIASFDNVDKDLEYAVKSGAWNVQTIDDTNNVGHYPSLALDSQDNPHILYFDFTENDYYHAWQLNGPWIIAAVTTGSDGVVAPTALKMDAQNVLHAFYTREETIFDIGYYAYGFDNYSWSETPVVGTSFADLALDGQGNVHIAAAFGGIGYHIVVREDSLQNTIFDVAGTVDEEVSIDVDPWGNPVISYFYDTTNDVRFADARVRLDSPTAGAMWAVGSAQTISWVGAGLVDIYLSTNGGATYDMIAESKGGLNNDYGEHVLTAPHTPSRFCKVKIQRNSPLSVSTNDSLFTIETSIALLAFTVSVGDGGSGNQIAWRTNPGPADLAGYRLDRKRGGDVWSTIVALTRETTLVDADGLAGDRYRLFGVNGLGQELLLGEASSGPQIPPRLDAWPQPYSGGELSISFATGSLGGVPIPTEVAVYDVAGRLVRLLVRDTFASGVQLITWDGRDRNGGAVRSGVYFLRAASGPLQQSKKIVIVR